MDIKRMFELLNIKLIKTATIANNNVYILINQYFIRDIWVGKKGFYWKWPTLKKTK